jgi:hypothetical protein
LGSLLHFYQSRKPEDLKISPKKKKEKFLAFKDLQKKRNANFESRI